MKSARKADGVSGRGQARWWNSLHRCRVTISAFAKAPAVSSQRDDKSLARGDASEPLVLSCTCSPSCRDGRVVPAPKAFGLFLWRYSKRFSRGARCLRLFQGRAHTVRFPGVRCAHPWLTSVVPFRTKCGRCLPTISQTPTALSAWHASPTRKYRCQLKALAWSLS